MFLFLLTAREGRVSANRFALRHRRNPRRATPANVPRRCICVSRVLAQRTLLKTKPAIARVFYVGTNSGWKRFSRRLLGPARTASLAALKYLYMEM